MKRLLFILAAIAAAAAAVPASAAASTSSAAAEPASATVGFVQCWSQGNGQATVPAGSTVTFRNGWEDNHLWQIYAFLLDVKVTASVDGTPVPKANKYFGAPEVFTPEPGVTGWVTWWNYPTGITLGAGQSLTFTTDWVLRYPLPEDIVHGQWIPAGSLFGGPISCTVTGT